MKAPTPNPLVLSLPSTTPFVGPEAIERQRGVEFRARLGANESAFGISVRARAAMLSAVDRLPTYNDPENHDLKEALAERHQVDAAEILVGAGIDDLLGLVVRAYLTPKTAAVASLGAYPTFIYHVHGFGARLLAAPYTHDGHNDLAALLALARQDEAAVVYLANPDNPSGTYHSARAQESFIAGLPENRVIIVDEAYAEFAPQDALLAPKTMDPRVVRMRTFSKAHGMAGARVGYAIAHRDVVETLDKIRLHFAVNLLAQAGALASLEDRAFVDEVVSRVEVGRREYVALGESLGLPTLPSATNFVTFDAGSVERADAILNDLIDGGVFVRKPGCPPLDRCFRVTVGREEERAFFAEKLGEAVRRQ